MTKKIKKSNESSKSWHNIDQPTGDRAVTGPARFRRWKIAIKLWAWSFVAVALAATAGYGIYHNRINMPFFTFGRGGHPISEIDFHSDGVLDSKWFHKVVQLPAEQGIMSLDIFDIKAALESHGQVKSAAVSIQLPNMVFIKIKERRPILRVRVATKQGGVERLLVASDGVVYPGRNYPGGSLEHLPYLGGIRFKRGPQGINPVPGMETVARLIYLARIRVPDIYATWRVVSCKQFDGNPDDPYAFISVSGSLIGEIIFAPENFEAQLDQLASIVDFLRRNNRQDIKRLDLSLEGQAVVQYNPGRNSGKYLY